MTYLAEKEKNNYNGNEIHHVTGYSFTIFQYQPFKTLLKPHLPPQKSAINLISNNSFMYNISQFFFPLLKNFLNYTNHNTSKSLTVYVSVNNV